MDDDDDAAVSFAPLPAVPSRAECNQVFEYIDYNDNGALSLPEIIKAAEEVFPDDDVCKPALMRAYKASDVLGHGFLKRRGFELLLQCLVYFQGNWPAFLEIERRARPYGDLLVKEAFNEACELLSAPLSEHSMDVAFATMEGGSEGAVVLDAFCNWIAVMMGLGRVGPKLNMPRWIELTNAFEDVDHNNTGALSLVEIAKAVSILHTDFDNQPALLRAYKAADTSGDGFIMREEFDGVLQYLVFFHDMWGKFEVIDCGSTGGRLALHEFKSACALCSVPLSRGRCIEEFNGLAESRYEGTVHFDAFCNWIARSHAPGSAGSPGLPPRTESGEAMMERARNLEEEDYKEITATMSHDAIDIGHADTRMAQSSPRPKPCSHRQLLRTNKCALSTLSVSEVQTTIANAGFVDLAEMFANRGTDGAVLTLTEAEDLEEYQEFKKMPSTRKLKFEMLLESWQDEGVVTVESSRDALEPSLLELIRHVPASPF